MCLKRTWVWGFPRLLRFQKRWGFMILDVNSCSNLAFTDQKQCQGWPSEPRWQRVAPTKKTCWENRLPQRGYLTITLSFFPSLFPCPLCCPTSLLFSGLSLESHQQWQILLHCIHFSLITHFSSSAPIESRWVSVSSRRAQVGVRL